MVLEHDVATPIVWFRVAVRGGTATDPLGLEGIVRHAGLLTRRGAGDKTRAELDAELDQLGASVGVRVSRDATTFAGVCLSRNLDAVFDMCADVVCRPSFSQQEHEKLVRESRATLDDMRDEDDQLAVRFFTRHVDPGHRYARTTVGTEQSLDDFEVDRAAATFRSSAVSDNVLLGFAGDIDERRASELEQRLRAGLASGDAPELPEVATTGQTRPRRIILVDKPERTQSQLLLGHVVPRYGSDDHAALIPVETVFGGTFTSRLNQEIRVKRGWSYGAGCDLERARGDYWLSMYLAPAADVTAPALRTVLDMYEQVAASGIDDDELAFAKSYLAGSMPFGIATCRQRLDVALRERLYDLPPGYRGLLDAQLQSLSLDQVNAAAKRLLRPQELCVVIVATADDMLPRLRDSGFTDIDVIPYDSY